VMGVLALLCFAQLPSAAKRLDPALAR